MRWFWFLAGPLLWLGCTTSIDDVEKKPGSGGVAGALTGGSAGTSSGGTGGSSSGGTGNTGATGGSDASTGGGGSGGTAGTDAASGGVAGTTEDAGGIGALAGKGSIEIFPTVADCIDTTNPNPDQCESVMGKYQMVVDLENSAMIGGSGAGGGPPTAVFVRFDLGPYLAAKTIVSAEYQMTITDYTNSGSSSSGEVFEVSSFTRADLFVSAPAKQSSVIGANQGTVATLETVSWQLPPVNASGKDTVCLGVFPTNNNGAYYYNGLGTTPPRLHIDYE